MEQKEFVQLLEALSTLTPEQTNVLSTALTQTEQSDDLPSSLLGRIERNFAAHPVCPHCHAEDIKRWGKEHGRQRYRCKDCLKTFTAFTKTPLARLRCTAALDQYVQCMMASMTLRPAAQVCGVSLETSFRLRHRLMEVIEGDKAAQLKGIVEMDETFFRESFKGQRNMPRRARKRGGRTAPGAKKEGGEKSEPEPVKKIPVWVACDRQGGITDAVLEHISVDEVLPHLAHHIEPKTPLVADAHLTHEAVAARLDLVLKELVSRAGIRVVEQVFHIQHVNAYHSKLKAWINGLFKGVATKYLYRYLGWQRLLSRDRLNVRQVMESIAGHWMINT